ncbi:N(2)-citryl-N(6)-acetyl-N(6)-hydroxylysine synthase [Pseudovibrio sp. W64]|nr:N(2)-citryl-N(6)-acetyl-N(6)-hydroxylysine synthase [Pseudovibrio sp. W64]
MNKTLVYTQANNRPVSAPPTPLQRAEHATASAFLNALLREWSGWSFLSHEQKELLCFCEDTVCLPLQNNDRLLLQVPHHTAARFEIQLPFYLWNREGHCKPVSLMSALTALITDSTISGEHSEKQFMLLSRVLDSHQAQMQAYELDANNSPHAAENWNFQDAEQALISGHPTHPNPRSRDELTKADALLLSPELKGQFPLFWVLADRSILVSGSGVQITAFDMCQNLAKSDETLPETLRTKVDKGYVPFAWHPWQAERLLARPQVIRWIQQGFLRPYGSAGQPFTATASMRGVHAFKAPYMLKFSLSMRLTNSKRVLARKEVERGVQMAELLSGPLGDKLANNFPNLTILTEPGYVALQDEDGGALEDSFVVLRDNPFHEPTQTGPAMLASLCEPHLGAPSPLSDLIYRQAAQKTLSPQELAERWLDAFMEVAILPLLDIRARHGLLFGSHQQNMMIALKDGMPAHLYVRDCQGTGHLTTHHDVLSAYVPDIGKNAENVVPPEIGDELLCYYVIVNNLLHTVSTLVIDGLMDEARAYDTLRRRFKAAAQSTTGDPAFYDYLLTSPTLVSKGNYRTSLSNVNEASGDGAGQLATFFKIANPFNNKRNNDDIA